MIFILEIQEIFRNMISFRMTTSEAEVDKAGQRKKNKGKRKLAGQHGTNEADDMPDSIKKKVQCHSESESVVCNDMSEFDKEEIESILNSENHSVRQVKKEKQKKNDVPQSEDETTSDISPAIYYLHLWSSDRLKWRFQKVRQVWLLQNMYDKQLVSLLLKQL